MAPGGRRSRFPADGPQRHFRRGSGGLFQRRGEAIGRRRRRPPWREAAPGGRRARPGRPGKRPGASVMRTITLTKIKPRNQQDQVKERDLIPRRSPRQPPDSRRCERLAMAKRRGLSRLDPLLSRSFTDKPEFLRSGAFRKPDTGIPGISFGGEKRRKKKLPKFDKSEMEEWAAQMNAEFEEAEKFDLFVE
ncbi:hypothetical protein E2320_013767 [Naja naja]|nr:hypothetical protein E2320_013767 [Naja naja]